MREIDETFNYEYYDRFLIDDFDDRRILLNSEIDDSVVDIAVHHIIEFNRQDKWLPIEERKPIRIYINSPGGIVSDGYGLIDVILHSKTPVYTINMALAASMAFSIFIAGHKRYTMPHAEFLIHDGTTGTFGSATKVSDRITFEAMQLDKMTREYILSRTKIGEELYKEKHRVEWYFLAEEAKEIGAVDYIIGQDCELDEIL